MQDYQKRLKKYYQIKEKQQKRRIDYRTTQKAKRTYFDKLFLRIFLGALLLLTVVGFDRFIFSDSRYIQNRLSEHMNVLKFASIFNGVFGDGLFIPSPADIPAVSTSLYSQVSYENNQNIIQDDSFSGVYNAVPGVVVRISKNNEKKYTITIKGIDDRTYHYGNLTSIDFSIYSYVAEKVIIGKASQAGDSYLFTLIIEEKGKPLSFYEICED